MADTSLRMIFINLPVTDLKASMAFYAAIGAENNPSFTDETAACMMFSETISVMLLTHEKWREFTSKSIPDPQKSSEVMLALSAASREAVDEMTKAAAANGGKGDVNPAQDHGFMYGRSFEDPDGHIWEPLWIDAEAVTTQQ